MATLVAGYTVKPFNLAALKFSVLPFVDIISGPLI